MSKSKVQAKGNTAIVEANQAAIETQFPKTQLRKAFDTMADFGATEANANEDKQLAAVDACRLASEYSLAAHAEKSNPDTGTVLQHWKANQKIFVAELAAAGHKFAEYSDAGKDKEQVARLTGYGKNVMSILRGVIEFQVEIASTDTYTGIRKIVEAERAEARSDEAKALAEAKERYREAAKDLLTEFGDRVELITEAAEVLERQCESLAAPEAETVEAQTG